MTVEINKDLARITEEVAREIVSTEQFGSASLIKTPIMYPSGAMAVAHVTQHQDRFFVTDMGVGHQEAEILGASLYFSRHGKDLAAQFGIRFDNQAFFVTEASRSQLAGAVTIVANCSAESVALAAYRAADRRFAEEADILYKRLTRIFTKDKVDRDVEFVGSSSHAWHVAAVVRLDNHKALFEPVSKNHTSVVNAAAKFHDIARLEYPPARISVVKNKREMGDYFNVLAQASTVIENKAPDDMIRKVAA